MGERRKLIGYHRNTRDQGTHLFRSSSAHYRATPTVRIDRSSSVLGFSSSKLSFQLPGSANQHPCDNIVPISLCVMHMRAIICRRYSNNLTVVWHARLSDVVRGKRDRCYPSRIGMHLQRISIWLMRSWESRLCSLIRTPYTTETDDPSSTCLHSRSHSCFFPPSRPASHQLFAFFALPNISGPSDHACHCPPSSLSLDCFFSLLSYHQLGHPRS